jgi:hypothetical protein
MQYKEGRLTGLVTSCIETAFYNMLWRKDKKMTGKQGRRHKQLLDDLKEMRILETESRSTKSHCL